MVDDYEDQNPLKIGDSHWIKDENGKDIPATLQQVTVLESVREAACLFITFDGRLIIGHIPLAKSEIEAWKKDPENYFIQKSRKTSA